MTKSKDKETILGDAVKKIVSLGVGAAFLTEDVIKSVVQDLPLSKDIINGLVQNAKNAKEDFVSSVREELSQHLAKVDPKALLEEILQEHDVEVTATFKFKKKDNTPSKKEDA